MKSLFDIFASDKKSPQGIRIKPSYSLSFAPTMPAKHEFRMRTIVDIQQLIEAGEKDLAKLEAQKLIAHLQKEFGV